MRKQFAYTFDILEPLRRFLCPRRTYFGHDDELAQADLQALSGVGRWWWLMKKSDHVVVASADAR